MPSKEEVEEALKKIHSCILRGSDHFIFLDDRPDNKQTLVELGYLARDVRHVVLELEVEDYYEGPQENKSQNVPDEFLDSEMWMFGKTVEGLVTKELYIKFSFIDTPEGPVTCCVSFHEAKHQIEYPFKK